MDLVDEQDRPRAETRGLFRIDHHLLDLLDAGHHFRKFDERRLRLLGDDLRQGGFAHSRRSPEDDRSGIVTLDLQPKRFSRSKQMLLSEEFFQRPRPHPFGQRSIAANGLVDAAKVRRKQAHAVPSARRARFCRRASYISVEPAIAAFSDSTAHGICTRASASASASADKPPPSLPIMRAQGTLREVSTSDVAPCEFATAAKSLDRKSTRL